MALTVSRRSQELEPRPTVQSAKVVLPHRALSARRTPLDAVEFQRCVALLVSRHSRFKDLVGHVGELGFNIPLWQSIDEAIVRSVIGQMLSTGAARAITRRLFEEHGEARNVIRWASQTANLSGPLSGVSQRKRKALASWRNHISRHGEVWRQWQELPISDMREDVGRVWGFGDWSADMLAIFYLGRMDVWPLTDTGIKNACRIVFNRTSAERVGRLAQGCETVAALYLWEVLNRRWAKLPTQ